MFQSIFQSIVQDKSDVAISVIGVGGAGSNALNEMVSRTQEYGVEGMKFFLVGTDDQALRTSSVHQAIQIGATITKGLGAGADPNVGYQAAEEDREALSNMISGADMVFIVAGMGGGTGTGAAPVIAEIAKSQGALTVGIVTKPFGFEGKKRSHFAEQGIKELAKNADSLIVIQNEKLLKVLSKKGNFTEAFGVVDNTVCATISGIANMSSEKEGLVSVDFLDLKNAMKKMGRATVGVLQRGKTEQNEP